MKSRLVGLAAILLLVAILTAAPAALAVVGADLIPQTLPTWDQIRTALTGNDDGTLALGTVTLIAWAAWAVLAAAVLLEIAARLRGVHTPDLRGLHLPQIAARKLVATAALVFAATPTAAVHTPATPSYAITAPPAHATAELDVLTASRASTAAPAAVGAAPQAPSAPAHTDEPAALAPTTYTVRRGDCLSHIARDQLGDATRWPEIVALNPGTLADHPDLIYPGTVVRLPDTIASPTGTATYTVRPGDWLSTIARDQLGDTTRWPEIVTLNPQLADHPDLIQPGTVLRLPAPATAPASTGDTTPAVQDTVVPDPTPTPAVAPITPPVSTAPATPSPVTPPASPHPEATTADRSVPSVPSGATQVLPDTDAAETDESDRAPAPWLLAGLSAGGALLAGSLLMLLRRRRCARFRHRRPGRTLAAPAPRLGPVEKTITAIGSLTAPTVEHLDAVLRRLAATAAHNHTAVPDLAAVELTATHLVLHLRTPATPPPPWQAATGTAWHIPADLPVDVIGPDLPDQPAPYPLLATIGADDNGHMWLLNLEDLDLTLTGDPTYAGDLARYLVAEIACHPWASGTIVDLVGVGEELVGLDPDRIHHHPPGTDDPIEDALAEAVHTIDRATDANLDVPTARSAGVGADAWPARLLLVDANDTQPVLGQLLEVVRTHLGRTATCVLLTGQPPATTSRVVEVTADGRLTVPDLGLDLVAVGLTGDEARGCALLLAQADDVRDVPVPIDDQATEGWRALADQAGALRAEHTLPRPDSADEAIEGSGSLLDQPDQTYLDAGATTTTDLHTLAPAVAPGVRDTVHAADPSLDRDVAMWFADNCPLPRLRLLGPVKATTRGTPLVKRKPYMTELLTYIATHPHGATPAEVADAFTLTAAKTREYVRIVRDWLGTNPRTGEAHLPDARYSPGATYRGTPVYQVLDLLVDLDLFRRLRLRGQASGPEGITDLVTALRLVEGRPFDAPVQRRAGGGWTWLIDGDRLDEHAAVAIVDVAHLVVTHALAAKDLATAHHAAETAAMAAPYEEIPRLDLAAVASAEGHLAEAGRIIRDQVANRSDDDGPPPELPARTEDILTRRTDWHGTKAS